MQADPVRLHRAIGHLPRPDSLLKPFLGTFLECRDLPALCHRLPRQFRDEVGEGALGFRVGAVEGACALAVLSRARVDPHAHPQLPFAALAFGLVLLQLDYGACALGFHGKIHLAFR